MNTKNGNIMTIVNKRLAGIALTVAFLLLLPLIAMQFTNEVNWKLFDFVVAGILLFTTGTACEFVWRRVKKTEHRIIIVLAILGVFLLIWIELAVGIFGTPLAGS